MPRSLVFLLALSLACWMLAPRSSAQCLLDDHLDGGPCCGLTQAQLPPFPNFVQDALNICWRDCGIDQQALVRGKWSNITLAGTVPACGEMRMRLDILTPSNVLLWRGPMRLVYSRTWIATGTPGTFQQVWRFLVNGDLKNFPAAGAPPCPVPSCAAAFGNRTHFTGYVDFAQDCTIPNGTFETAWMLTHACDALDHHSGFPRAGVFHPDRSFSFVGPAAGFVAGPLQPTEGTLSSGFDSVRLRTPTPPPLTLACTYEEPVVHTLTPQTQLCFCGLPGSNQFLIGDLNIQGPCGIAIRNPSVGPLLPGYVSMGIGSWTNPGVYPGQQSLRWNIGGYDVVDICVGTVLHEVFYGVTTIGGHPAIQIQGGMPTNPLPPIFIDQGSAQKPNGSQSMNTNYTSFYIVNLNH